MPDKTHGEQLRELHMAVARLDESSKRVADEAKRLHKFWFNFHKDMNALAVRVALTEQLVSELKQASEEAKRRNWSLVGPILAAVVGGVVATLMNWLIDSLRH